MNGHSDSLIGSTTGSKEIINKVIGRQWIYGTIGGTFSSWPVLRGMRTLGLRISRQMENATKLAGALSNNPYILKVNYPSVEGYPQADLAKKVFGENGYGEMLSFEMPACQRDKMNRL